MINIENTQTTGTDQSNKLSIQENQVFKYEIIEFKLSCKDNSVLNIPVTKDGYVNCTKLCQAGKNVLIIGYELNKVKS